ncbi:MAG: hypothetical protein R3D66_05455 [Alphaproteobacteria bacterium]
MNVFEQKMPKALKALPLLLTIILPYSALAQNTGEMHYSTPDTRYEFFDGSNWYGFDLGIPLGVCTKEAEIEFDTLLSTYKYCNGAFWIPVAGIVTLSGCTQKGEVDFFNSAYHFCNGLLWVRMKGSLL